MKKWNFTAGPLSRHTRSRQTLSRQTGFTLIELMISVVLLAIGAALALPSYREMVEKRQVTHGAEQIMAFVNSAQMEAIKQNSVVTLSFTRNADDDWCVGAALEVPEMPPCDCMEEDADADDFCAIDSAPRVINNENAGNTQLVKSITGPEGLDYCFDPVRGLAHDVEDVDGVEKCNRDEIAGEDLLEIELSSNNQNYQLNLTVSNTGQAVLCSKDSSHRVPGYSVCPPSA